MIKAYEQVENRDKFIQDFQKKLERLEKLIKRKVLVK